MKNANSVAVNDGNTQKVTQIFIPKTYNSDIVIMPLVASFSHQNKNRWLTWITQRHPSKQVLQVLGADISRIRVIRVEPSEDYRWVIWQALNAGNSHTVVTESSHLSYGELLEMELAAIRGECQALFLVL